MTPKQRTELKDKLLADRDKLKLKVKDLEALTKIEAPDCAVDKIDREGAMQEVSLLMQSLEKTRQKLLQVESALNRIDDPDYGRCARCGNPIPIKRLMIAPESRLCVVCAGRTR